MRIDVGAERKVLDPDYFSLRIRQACTSEAEEGGDCHPDDYLAGLCEPSSAVLAGEFAVLASHPDVVEAGAAVVDAEAAVMAAEDAGVPDELAMRRLDKARAAEQAVLVRLQRRRALAHTARAESRVAVVVPLHAARSAQVRGFGGAA